MNCSTVIGIGAVAEELFDSDVDIEFFFDFPDEALLRSFSDFDFTTGEFPFSSMPDSWFPAGYKEFVFVN